jgi:hypothetical protein
MVKNTIKWTGENQIEISKFLGNENFHHKNGELFVQTTGGRFTVKKGEYFGITEEGAPYPFIDPHGLSEEEQASMKKLLKESGRADDLFILNTKK